VNNVTMIVTLYDFTALAFTDSQRYKPNKLGMYERTGKTKM